MQKLNCILKTPFSNDELTPRAKKNQDILYNRNKNGH